ncbi:NAD(P)/FAD-dependent oxidoreductase [Evansella sp. LMS18]|uniref:NAD(P)/FAD-dependent oxidoreductase n=1 Tax=Evansella sp. LMS18 TaxID=2924033 RepID=UPI0020D0F782|nr:NAD(P)/FAD-dependent oxidoreductase [Evansella sp. LMS18]UTR11455.1 NAD(P)/FAD-dependent oxidoreductase [Evansella sp. LMS18]
MKDVIVIGGGPSGLMASIAAAQYGAKVVLIDKGDKLGRKLAISGGGRCNVTNVSPIDQLIENIPGNGQFMHSPFSVFNNQDIIGFFEELGIKLKEEDRGRMFPVSDKAKTVVNTLLNKVNELGVEIRTNTGVKDLKFTEDRVDSVILANGEKIKTKNIIVAVGGKSVPYTGSTGDGYPWAKKAGHTITELYPTEVPITAKDRFIKEKLLQGLSLRDVKLTVLDPSSKKAVKSHEGDMVFTHFGVSGPIALRCSQFVIKAKKEHNVKEVALSLDLFPHKGYEDVQGELEDLLQSQPKKAIKNALNGWLPERIIPVILDKAGVEPSIVKAELSNDKKRSLINSIKEFSISATGTLSIEKAFVTGGGVSVKEIKPKKMESKFKKGLFFCGEVLDLHGYTGGYNITVAFSTGYTAGQAAAMNLWEES